MAEQKQLSQKRIYDRYHDNPAFAGIGKSTYKGGLVAQMYDDVSTVLDFGCGTGYAVRRLRSGGYDAEGYEYSGTAFDKYLREPGFFNRLEDVIGRSYDLVYSTEVLEHIPEELVGFYCEFFAEICDKHVFMTISLRPSSDNNAYHCTLKPREWWESVFERHGFEADRDVVEACQRNKGRSTREILSQFAGLGPFPQEFAENPPYELNGEEQPWFFAFNRRK